MAKKSNPRSTDDVLAVCSAQAEPLAGHPGPHREVEVFAESHAKREDRAEPRNHRELAEAIFAGCDPVRIGRELLESGNDKGASVRARVFETLTNWQFGKISTHTTPNHTRVRVIWTIPGPPRESEEPK